MKKILLSVFVIAGFLAYYIQQKTQPQTQVSLAPQSQPTSSNPPVSNNPNQNLKDGAYTGTVADAFYGPLQVQATISGGRITDVAFLQYPSDQRESIQVNTRAMPLLKSEAISVQNANVDIVTGATQTSEAFRQTFQAALDQAK